MVYKHTIKKTDFFTEIVEKHGYLMDHQECFDGIIRRLDESVQKLDSPIIEIGSNRGGSALSFMEIIKKNKKSNWLFCIDPYGNSEYNLEEKVISRSEYGNDRYRLATKHLFEFAYEEKINFSFFKMISEDFMNFVYPNLKIYDDGKVCKVEKFSFVFLDGRHDSSVLDKEISFFLNKIEIGGYLIIDDVNEPKLRRLESKFLAEGFEKNKDELLQRVRDIDEKTMKKEREYAKSANHAAC